MKYYIIAFITVLLSCDTQTKNIENIESIVDIKQQTSIFENLIVVTNNDIDSGIINDSLAFLILPLEASCPSCRNKVIDSIAKHGNDLLPNHFIILSANGGKKKFSGYFKARGYDLPTVGKFLFLDSNNTSNVLKLYDMKPTFFYTSKKKVFRKVSSTPASVKQDLNDFFTKVK